MIPVAEPFLGEKELEYVTDCVKSGWISSMGKYVNLFEGGFSKYCNSKHGVAVSNGTVALHLALAALGIGKGDEVIIPDLTFVATANAVAYTGAKPVMADIDKETWCIDTEKIKDKLTKKTKAIIPVHLYGHPCDMDPIMELADGREIKVIEDAAEAHGAEYKGKKVGSIGHIGCFSFYGNKIITTGEGGICLTDDEKLAERMRFLKDHGMSKEKRYWYDEIAYNYRMTNIQAALGVAQLEKIDKIVEAKRKNAQIYNSLLKGLKDIVLPAEKEWAKNVYWMYSILVDNRDELIKKLEKNGIDSRPFFYPIHQLPMYKLDGQFPVSNEVSIKGINLPSSPTLAREQIEHIVKVIISS
ncbi:MAG: DegT/DnrJ/EryC1/StrS family aminotransferase [Nanoarchaeota archaeon]